MEERKVIHKKRRGLLLLPFIKLRKRNNSQGIAKPAARPRRSRRFCSQNAGRTEPMTAFSRCGTRRSHRTATLHSLWKTPWPSKQPDQTTWAASNGAQGVSNRLEPVQNTSGMRCRRCGASDLLLIAPLRRPCDAAAPCMVLGKFLELWINPVFSAIRGKPRRIVLKKKAKKTGIWCCALAAAWNWACKRPATGTQGPAKRLRKGFVQSANLG